MFAAATAISAIVSFTIPATAQADPRIVRLQGGGIRFLDAHEIPEMDFHVVTRPFQGFDTTQQWRMNDLGGGVNTIQQISSGRFLDATLDGDFQVVTAPQGSQQQEWRVGDP